MAAQFLNGRWITRWAWHAVLADRSVAYWYGLPAASPVLTDELLQIQNDARTGGWR